MNQKFFTCLLLMGLMFNNIHLAPLDNIELAEDEVNDIDEKQLSTDLNNNRRTNLDQMNVCIDICYECFKEEMTKSTEVNVFNFRLKLKIYKL